MISRLESDVTMNAAYLPSSGTIAAHVHTTLQSVDHHTIFAAIYIPPARTERLHTALARHGKTIISR